MKTTILISLILLLTNATFAQITTKDTVLDSYSDTVSLKGTKDEIYIKAGEYLARTTALTKNELQLNDKDSGKLVAKSKSMQDLILGGIYPLHFEINYTTSISVKDNKYKYVLSDIYFDKVNVTPKEARLIINKVIEELKSFMSAKSQTDF